MSLELPRVLKPDYWKRTLSSFLMTSAAISVVVTAVFIVFAGTFRGGMLRSAILNNDITT